MLNIVLQFSQHINNYWQTLHDKQPHWFACKPQLLIAVLALEKWWQTATKKKLQCKLIIVEMMFNVVSISYAILSCETVNMPTDETLNHKITVKDISDGFMRYLEVDYSVLMHAAFAGSVFSWWSLSSSSFHPFVLFHFHFIASSSLRLALLFHHYSSVALGSSPPFCFWVDSKKGKSVLWEEGRVGR